MFSLFKKKPAEVPEPIVLQNPPVTFIPQGNCYCADVPWTENRIWVALNFDSKKSHTVTKALTHFLAIMERSAWWDDLVKQKFVEEVFGGKETTTIADWSHSDPDSGKSYTDVTMTREAFYRLISLREMVISPDGGIAITPELNWDGELLSPDGYWIRTEITGTHFTILIN